MAHSLKHHGHKSHHVGKKGRKRRSQVSGFSKDGITDIAVVGGTALGTKVALDFVTPKLVAAVGATTLTPTVLNYGKVALGVAIGAMAEGKMKKVLLGVAVGMIADGGGKIADSIINGTAMVAGNLNMPVRYAGPTVAGKYGRVRGVLNQPVNYSGPTVAGTKGHSMVCV
jgi:hypothetical protein